MPTTSPVPGVAYWFRVTGHSPEDVPPQSDVEGEENGDGRTDDDGESSNPYERIDAGQDQMETANDISHETHLG